jgi:hypothetical protein
MIELFGIKLVGERKVWVPQVGVLADLCRSAALILCLGGSMAMAAAPAVLVKEGQAQGRIVLGDHATEPEKLAAKELQSTVREISTATLPIENKLSDSGINLVLGTPRTNALVRARQQAFQADLDFLKGSDGFALRQDGNNIYIFSGQGKGVLNGTYAFLEQNTGILWFRAGQKGAAYQPSKTITITHANGRQRPAFDLRGWHMVSIWKHVHQPTELWMARNRCNFKPTLDPYLSELGMRTVEPSNHNLGRFLPNDKYFKAHPEYYAMIDGKRRPIDMKTQICFSNREMASAFAHEVIDQMDQSPPNAEFGIVIQDGNNVCQCPLCTAPIHLPDGTVVKPGDEAFRSTQFYLFLNRVAEAVYKKYPKKRIFTLAYIFTAVPPKVKPFKTIDIGFCPYVRDDKHPLDSSYNHKWLVRLKEWAQAVDPHQILLREYYGDASAFCRPIARTVQTDMKLYHALGLGGIYAEMPPDSDRPRKGPPLSDHWDASMMPFWLITRLYWNPDADLGTLKQEYLKKVYGPAAGAMGRYYELIENSWYASDQVEHWNATPQGSARRYIQSAGIETACRTALDQAAAAAPDSPVKERVASMRRQFDGWMKAIAEHPVPSVTVPKAGENVSKELNFTAPAWKNAAVIDHFSVMGKPGTPVKNKTVIHLLYDQANLYVGVECFGGDTTRALAATVAPYEQFPSGDRIELFIGGGKKAKGSYYQLAFNAAGTKYDGKAYDKSWNGDWSVIVRRDKQSWRAVATIPWNTIGADPASDKTVAALFYRLADSPKSGVVEHGTWGGGMVHAVSGFGNLKLETGK